VCADASTVLRAVVVDFFFNCWCLEISLETIFGMYQGASTITHKAFYWKCSSIFMLEVEAVPQTCVLPSQQYCDRMAECRSGGTSGRGCCWAGTFSTSQQCNATAMFPID
jgi:hypothetical protein